MDWQSNPNPITIQLFLEKGIRYLMAKFYDAIMEFPRDISYQLTPFWLINFLKILKKSSFASLLEHNPLWNFNIMIK
jgi:hypothetical protein